MSTVRDALEAATDALRAAGVDSPRLDAEVLLAEASGASRASLVASPEEPIDPVATRAFAEFVRRRLRREPVAYITGRKGFRRIELAVDRRVLIPRPETELLVELALELQPRRVLDVGTGSGAIAFAIADEVPDAAVVATDLYPDALEAARENAARLSLTSPGPPRARHTRLGKVRPAGREPAVRGRARMARAGARAPRLGAARRADSRPDGFEAIDALLGELTVSPATSANAIGLEVGEGQAETVADLVRRAGFADIEVRKDLAGIDRVVVGHAEVWT